MLVIVMEVMVMVVMVMVMVLMVMVVTMIVVVEITIEKRGWIEFMQYEKFTSCCNSILHMVIPANILITPL
jgi:hypothetical protein